MENTFALHVKHISTMLVVKDLDTSVDFYKNLFGFKVVRYEKDIIALVELNNIQLYFIPYSPATSDKPGVELKAPEKRGVTPVSIVFNVSNCDQSYQLLSSAGLQFLTPPQSPPWGGKRCFALDPDGYLIEIEEGT